MSETQSSVVSSMPSAPGGPMMTLSIPRFNLQVVALALIALIAAFQTFQLVMLKQSVLGKAVAPAASGASSAPAAAPANNALPGMVGGC